MRFHEAQIGDKVFCRTFGTGVLLSVESGLQCEFGPYVVYFGIDGRLSETNDSKATLFYIDGDNNYTSTRPPNKIDWSKVPVDTKVLVRNFKDQKPTRRYYAGKVNDIGYECFANGMDSWSSDKLNTTWRHIEFAEEV